MAASLALGVRFVATSAGTGSFVDATAVTGYRRGLGALTTGKTYRYRAESASLSEWEWGTGTWNNTTGTLTRTVTFSSTGSAVSFTVAPQVSITIEPGDLLSFTDAQTFSATEQKQARANIGTDDRNLIINPDFRINQRLYASGAALAAGAFGHDRWKSTGGGSYTFTQLSSSTQINVTGSLTQIIEGTQVEGGSYVLSWEGTATAKVGVNTTTPPGGGYASSPITVAGQTANSPMVVEIGGGTLGKVKLEKGTVPTPFTMPDFSLEFLRCYRYCWQWNADGAAQRLGQLAIDTSTTGQMVITLPTPLRSSPNISFSGLTPYSPSSASPYGGYMPGAPVIGVGFNLTGAPVNTVVQIYSTSSSGSFFRLDSEI
jgi:hypothetical protein